jgi:hypothetical protein
MSEAQLSSRDKPEVSESVNAETLPQPPEPLAAPATPASSGKRVAGRKVLQLTLAFLGFVIGLVMGPYAEELLARANPGFFGPDNQQVIEDQQANFAALEAKLAELRLTAGDDPASKALIGELGTLLQEQKNLTAKKDELFKATDIAQQTLKEELLRERGTSGAIDFWIKIGESVILRDPDKSLSVTYFWSGSNQIDVNISGEKTRMAVGDAIPIKTAQGEFTLLYRQTKRDSDDRFGFDLAGPK